jgi:signal transduction histidine kinase
VPPGAAVDMHVDGDGRVWMASERSGLVRIDNRSAVTPTFGIYTTAQGLSSSSIAAITEGGDGFLYLGGGHGIDRFDPRTASVRRFTASDGLHPGVLRSAYRAMDGMLWFGMSNGIVRLRPSTPKPPLAPRVLISGLRIAGQTHHVSPVGETEVSLADLPPDRNQMEIEFVGLGFQPGEVLRYQYKLGEADRDWSLPTARRTVTYASLAPGDYVFEVRAIDADRTTSDTPASIRFTVLPPLWLRWWFLTGALMVFATAVSLAYRYRVARLLEVANMRTHIATDLHDDIGANLTRIALLSEVAKRSREEATLETIATIARESVSAMSDIVWAVNPKRETLRDLTRRMRQHADHLFTQRGIQLRFTGPADDTQRLGMDIRRDVLLVFKEAVNNAARHSNCAAVVVVLRVDDDTLTLTVADDGIGFQGDDESEGNGLTSMRRRAARLKGTLSIESRAPSGTLVTLSVPL